MTGADGAVPAAGDRVIDPRPPVDPADARRPGCGLALALPGSAVAAALLARAAPGTVESLYSRGLYPALAEALVVPARWWSAAAGPDDALMSPRPALGEVLLAGFVLWLLIRLRATLRRGPRATLRWIGQIAGVLAWWFLLAWGLNYARAPVAGSLGLAPGPPASAAELEDIARRLMEDVALDLTAGADPEVSAVDDAVQAWARASTARPELGALPAPAVAAPLLSSAFTASSITGLFNPFTHEVNVCAGLVPVDRAFVACHELAHRVGWAREDEANFLAWYVGAGFGSPWVRRGVNALALLHVMGALRRADGAALARLLDDMPEELLVLLREREAYWLGVQVESATRVASRVNDAYLRAHGQDGVASYGRMVDLVVAEMRRRGQSKDAPLDSR